MKRPSVDYREEDRIIWEEELNGFIPSRMIDAHNHLYSHEVLTKEAQKKYSWYPDVDFAQVKAWCETFFPGREVHHLFLGVPFPGTDVKAYNEMVIRETGKDPLSRRNRLVTPECTRDEIESDIKKGDFIGLKPYRLYSLTGDVQQCRIKDFLPEPQLELANELGLWVSMHLSRFHGCADEWNLKDLEEYTTRSYPGIKWILCHCARSFTYWPISRAVERLSRMPNIWYDLSGVCDIRPFLILFQRENLKRLFFGSDMLGNFFHGTYLALGRAWQFFDADNASQVQFAHCDGRPILSIYEQLLSMKHAAEFCHLTDNDIEDIFWHNAVREFGIDWTDK